MITIDGSEGGGQILRSALSLAMVTGQEFSIKNIRGKRPKPGLMRQHLTCVKAAEEICHAKVDGAELHSQELNFRPGSINPGDYSFSIGSAGSTTLLFQTLLPALSLASSESSVKVEGGTHNPMAPTADFISQSFLPQVAKLGIRATLSCPKIGFAPAGGGIIEAQIQPHKEWGSIDLTNRSDLQQKHCQIIAANLPAHVIKDEIKSLEKVLCPTEWQYEIREENQADGAGNLVVIGLQYANQLTQFTSHGKFGKSAARVVKDAVKAMNTFEKSNAAIDSRLADQLLLPMALAKGGQIKVNSITNHITTNIKTIERFLDTRFTLETLNSGEILISL